MKTFLTAVALLSAGVHIQAQTAARGMTVFVTVAPMADMRVDEETRKVHSAKTSAAIKARKDLDKALKAQHGGNRGKWPKEAQNSYTEAEELVAELNADWVYRRHQQNLADSVADIKRAVAGIGVGAKENVLIVPSLNDAQLVVEVVGRRSERNSLAALPGSKSDQDNEFWILFNVKAGPKLPADRFAAVPRDYRLLRVRYNVARLAAPRPDSTQWRFEAHNYNEWFHAGNAVAILIEDFIARNYDAMTGSR